jgi:LacI family transcriptional regulator
MKKTSMPQLKDIATEASVSMTTASIILRNGNGRFAEKTRQRVLEAAKKLGWRQNLLVQSIQTGKTRSIGVLIPPFDSHWTNILTGIHQVLTDADYMPITLWIGDGERFADNGEGLEQIHKLVDRRVEGLVVWPDFATAYEEYFIELVAEHLLGLGHTHIGCITETEKAARSWQLRRQRYFEFALKTLAPEARCKSWHMVEGDRDAVRVTKEVLQSKDRPTAIFADTDHVANDVYNAVADLGLTIPDDISVVGFSGLDFTKRMRPPLTTVRQNSVEVGKCAGRMIIQRIKKEVTGPVSTVKVGCELIVRESTSKPRQQG